MENSIKGIRIWHCAFAASIILCSTLHRMGDWALLHSLPPHTLFCTHRPPLYPIPIPIGAVCWWARGCGGGEGVQSSSIRCEGVNMLQIDPKTLNVPSLSRGFFTRKNLQQFSYIFADLIKATIQIFEGLNYNSCQLSGSRWSASSGTKKLLLRIRRRRRRRRSNAHPWLYITHRRRIELEDKAKVVVSDWGTESLPR